MAFIVPDHIEERQTCWSCGRYLSVMPIKVYPTGLIKCGRCTKEGDGGARSIYNTLFANSLCHCVNRYDGCGALLEPSNVIKHEEICAGEPHRCPICKEFVDTSYNLYRHIKSEHASRVLSINEIDLFMDRDIDAKFVYCEKNMLFVIDVIFSFETKTVDFGISCLKHQFPQIPYTCTISTLSGTTVINSLVNNCTNYIFEQQAELTEGAAKKVRIKFVLDIPNYVTDLTENLINTSVNTATFRYKLQNFNNLSNDRHEVFSPTYYINRIPLQLLVKVNPYDNLYSFGLFLYVDKNGTIKKSWSCMPQVQFKLISLRRQPIPKHYCLNLSNQLFTKHTPFWGFAQFKDLFDILKPDSGFIRNNAITIEMKVTIESFKFEE